MRNSKDGINKGEEKKMNSNNSEKQHHHHLNGGCSNSNGDDDAGNMRHHHHPADHHMILSRRRRRPPRAHCLESSSSSSTTGSLLSWQAYKEWVYRHEAKLHWVDAIVSRLLWWLPAGGGGFLPATVDGDQQLQQQQQHYDHHQQHQHWPREVIWGLLQLNRLFVDLALEEKYQQDNNSRFTHNGTTLRLHQQQQQQHGAGDDDDDDDDEVTSHRLRMGLDIIQSMWPVALELAAATTSNSRNNSNNNNNNNNIRRLTILRRRQAAVGLFLERVRFVLKMYFLLRYWKQWSKQQQRQQHQQRQQQQETTTSIIIPPGIMQMGGLLTAAAASSSFEPTLEQEQARLERANYVGRRTGRRVVASPSASSSSSSSLTAASSSLGVGVKDDSLLTFGWRRIKSLLSSANLTSTINNNKTTTMMMRLVVGELLYVFRPLFWAQAQWDGYNHEYAVEQVAAAASAAAGVDNPIIDTARANSDGRLFWLWKAWLISLGMDVTSLMSLSNMATPPPTTTTSNDRNSMHHNNNPATVQEWKRRRLRLLLYLLRSPVWEVYTERLTDMEHGGGSLSGRLSRHVPLVGGMLAAYLQDWLYYWKVYRAEEG